MELAGLEYQRRLSVLLEHRIGRWDVIADARHSGSLDSDIRGHANNDLLALLTALPELDTIAFNGGTAAKIGMQALGETRSDIAFFHCPPAARRMLLFPMRRNSKDGDN